VSLKLAKDVIFPYDYYSESGNTDPITLEVTLDNSGGITSSTDLTAYLVATTFNYTSITVTPITEDTGINWKVSEDLLSWNDSINLDDMDAVTDDVLAPIYFKVDVNNTGTVVTGDYVSCKVRISATENP